VDKSRRDLLIASLSIVAGLVSGIAVLLVTTFESSQLESHPQVPTVLFFLALGLLGYGCHKGDCMERERHR